jgi:hypothetical protein
MAIRSVRNLRQVRGHALLPTRCSMALDVPVDGATLFERMEHYGCLVDYDLKMLKK